MTLSEREQTENLAHAFDRLMKELGERAITQAFFKRDEETFRQVLQTTWKEMCDQGWCEEIELYGQIHSRLTGNGWLEGLWRTGAGKEKEFSARHGHLSSALKRYVKGRSRDIVVELAKLIVDCGLPEGFVFNAIEARLEEEFFRKKGASWEMHGVLVRIPLNFGLPLIDHSVEMRAELESLREELKEAKQELTEYKCSCCGAPIDGQGGLPLSEHDEGYFVSYSCGRYEIDGDVDRPCPSAKFPSFDEYRLQSIENTGGPIMKALIARDPSMRWKCEASPLTVHAQQFSLSPGYAPTKEEAEQRILENYQKLGEKWQANI
jgi:hypothetical protein